MSDPGSASEWITFWADHAITLLTSPATVVLLGLLIFRKPLIVVVRAFEDRFRDPNQTVRLSGLGVLLEMSPKEAIESELAAAEAYAAKFPSARSSLEPVINQLSRANEAYAAAQSAIRAAEANVDLLAYRIARRALFYAEQVRRGRWAERLSNFKIVMTSEVGGGARHAFSVTGALVGDAALILTLVQAVTEGNADFRDAAYETWRLAANELAGQGIPTSELPFSREDWDLIRSATSITAQTVRYDES